jgi:hypothetical protein
MTFQSQTIHESRATSVLATGSAATREAAYRLARNYYDVQPDPNDDVVLEASRVLNWLHANRLGQPPGQTPSSARPEEPRLDIVAVGLRKGKYRVLADAQENRTVWRDVSGYPIGMSNRTLQYSGLSDWDFVADIGTGVVAATPYL